MVVPIPTKIYRIVHVDNLRTCLLRQALHATNTVPDDGHSYHAIHNTGIQEARHTAEIACGPQGCMHDYVPFYFGILSPMLLQLKTGQVPRHTGGQSPIIYLVTTAQIVEQSGTDFVFSDGHGLAAFTRWYDNLSDLNNVDWGMVSERYWADTIKDSDRQRRKQAEFLVYGSCSWDLIQGIGVIDEQMKIRVDHILSKFPEAIHKPVVLRPSWYYR